MPKHTEEYVHRVGRTGRAGNKGDAISFVGPKDWDSFKRVETYLQQDINFSQFDGLEGKFKGLKPAKQDYRGKAKSTKKPSKNTKLKTKKAIKRDKSFHQNVSVGDNVFIPKKKSQPKTDKD